MKDFSIIALGSGKGSTIDFFCEKLASQNSLKIKALVTENPSSGLLQTAKKFHLPCHILKYKGEDFKAWDQKLCQLLSSYSPQLIVLAGFLKKIGPVSLSRFQGKMINSHPSLLPEFSGDGMYGIKVHSAVLQAKKTHTGISIHIVSANYDEGPLLAQKRIKILEGESALQLESRLKQIEKPFYLDTIVKIARGEISLEDREKKNQAKNRDDKNSRCLKKPL